MADVFISYHVNSAGNIVQRIRGELERRGISCWNSEKDVQGGRFFAEEVPRQIDVCRVFLLVLDNGANQSFHVQNELHLAVQRIAKGETVDIIPFYLLNEPLTDAIRYDLARFQRINGQIPPTGQDIIRLADSVANAIADQRRQEEKQRQEAERRAREEAERKAREEAERREAERREAERRAREEAERKARRIVELREAIARKKAEEQRLAEKRWVLQEEEQRLAEERRILEKELSALEEEQKSVKEQEPKEPWMLLFDITMIAIIMMLCIGIGVWAYPKFVNLIGITTKASSDIYVVLKGDGELVFYGHEIPGSGDDLMKPYHIDPDNPAAPWCNTRTADSIEQVTFADKIQPVSTLSWFKSCTNLHSINKIKNLDTSQVTNMSHMFSGCTNLTSVDVSDFDTGKVTNMSYMFLGCSSLETIYASDKFITDIAEASDKMFSDCKSLSGGNGTKYSADHTDKEYARIDGGQNAPGYFTEKP